jgi:ubiquinone/menaquinone biosynthesis C-methylase UbiE
MATRGGSDPSPSQRKEQRLIDWREIWERKGRENSSDLRVLDGFNETTLDPSKVAQEITKTMGISPTDRVLEVGCGAGMIAQFLKCEYVGVDYSHSLVGRHKELFGHSVVVGEADKLEFEDKSFDKVFAYSVFHYFPDHEYAKRVVQQMKRISRSSIFIGDLPFSSHSQSHLLYPKDMFNGWKLTEGYYNPLRYNVLWQKNGAEAF